MGGADAGGRSRCELVIPTAASFCSPAPYFWLRHIPTPSELFPEPPREGVLSGLLRAGPISFTYSLPLGWRLLLLRQEEAASLKCGSHFCLWIRAEAVRRQFAAK